VLNKDKNNENKDKELHPWQKQQLSAAVSQKLCHAVVCEICMSKLTDCNASKV